MPSFSCSVHVVFGQVVSGQDLVTQLEQLAVDRNSRPLQDASIANCGELVRQVKGEWGWEGLGEDFPHENFAQVSENSV